jgi:glycosyltransferase involved in cell wall biosynthesis
MAKKTYYFDVTDLYIYFANETTVSGIQRVSFEVITRAIDALGVNNVWLTYWDKRKREYLAIPTTFLKRGSDFTPELFASVFFDSPARSQRQTAPTLIRYRNRPFKYRFHWLMRHYHAWLGDDEHFRKKGSSLVEWRSFVQGDTATPTAARTGTLPVPVPAHSLAQMDDALIILGALWNIEGVYEQIKILRDQNQMDIRQLVHDLIPVLTPEHLGDNFSMEFYYWLENSINICTRFLANSENTARDLQRFMSEVGQSKPISVVPLAQKFTTAILPNDLGSSLVDRLLKTHLKEIEGINLDIQNLTKIPYVLVVGTMESRKNAWRLGQVWKRLAEDRDIEVPRLVFAGKPGWHNSDFDQLMNGTNQLGGWVQFVKRPTDAELQFLYKNCLFTAMISFYEGWGLPIGEGLSFGKTGVVGNSSSLPEVGGDLVEYCDVQSIGSIYAACRRLIEEPTRRKALETKIANTTLRTWDDVANDVVELIKN